MKNPIKPGDLVRPTWWRARNNAHDNGLFAQRDLEKTWHSIHLESPMLVIAVIRGQRSTSKPQYNVFVMGACGNLGWTEDMWFKKIST